MRVYGRGNVSKCITVYLRYMGESQTWFGCVLSGFQQHLLDHREAAHLKQNTIFAFKFDKNKVKKTAFILSVSIYSKQTSMHTHNIIDET